MAGPGDEAAAGHGRMRASHADREQVIDVLKVAFVQGRLDRDELGLRVGRALGSRTCAELAALTADLPAGQAAAHPPELARAQRHKPVPRPGSVIGVATVLYAGVWAAVMLLSLPAVGILTITSLLYYMIVVLIGGYGTPPRDTRPGGRPPLGPAPLGPAPGAGGQVSGRPPSADLTGQLPAADHDRKHTTEAAPGRLPRPPLPGLRLAVGT